MLIKIIEHTVCNGENVKPGDMVDTTKHAAKFLISRKFAESANASEQAALAKVKAEEQLELAKEAEAEAEKSYAPKPPPAPKKKAAKK